MEGIAYLEEILSLNRYNPRVKIERRKILSTLQALRTEGELTEKQYGEYRDRISGTFSAMDQFMRRIFNLNKVISKKGYFNLTMKEGELSELLETRKICEEFYGWADPKRHQPENPTILNYLKTLAGNFLKDYQAKTEDRWGSFQTFKSVLLASLVNGVVFPSSIGPMGKILVLGVQEYEEEVIRLTSVTEDTEKLQKALVFGGVETRTLNPLYNPVEIAVEMVTLFTTKMADYRSRLSHYHQLFQTWKKEGKITDKEFKEIREHFDLYGVSMSTGLSPTPEAILIHYGVERTSGDLSHLHIYRADQIVTAINFAYEFRKNITNDFLITELVQFRLNFDLTPFDYDQKTVKAYYKKDLESNLSLLNKYGVLPAEDYKRYLALGKEKFG